jgi:hypothetical protein
MRRLAATLLLAATTAGCNAAGEPSGARRFSDKHVPFTFRIPANFTKASVDDANSRGAVVAAAGLTKVDVVAVRRQTPHGSSVVRHEVLGQPVTSELHPIAGQSGWTLECQYTADRAQTIRDACLNALQTVRRR